MASREGLPPAEAGKIPIGVQTDLTGESPAVGYGLVDSSEFGGEPVTLAGLTDVDISSPADGQGLVFNATSGKWEPLDLAGGGVPEAVAGTTFSTGIVNTGLTVQAGGGVVYVGGVIQKPATVDGSNGYLVLPDGARPQAAAGGATATMYVYNATDNVYLTGYASIGTDGGVFIYQADGADLPTAKNLYINFSLIYPAA